MSHLSAVLGECLASALQSRGAAPGNQRRSRQFAPGLSKLFSMWFLSAAASATFCQEVEKRFAFGMMKQHFSAVARLRRCWLPICHFVCLSRADVPWSFHPAVFSHDRITSRVCLVR